MLSLLSGSMPCARRPLILWGRSLLDTRHLIAYLLIAILAVGFVIALYHGTRRSRARWMGRRREARRRRERVSGRPPVA